MNDMTKKHTGERIYNVKLNFSKKHTDNFPHCKCPNKERGIYILKSDFSAGCPNYKPKVKE